MFDLHWTHLSSAPMNMTWMVVARMGSRCQRQPSQFKIIRDSVKQTAAKGNVNVVRLLIERGGGEFLPDFLKWTLYAKHHDSDRIEVSQIPVECIRERKEAELFDSDTPFKQK